MPIRGTRRLSACCKSLDQKPRPDIPAVQSATPDRNFALPLRSSKKTTRFARQESLTQPPGRRSTFAEQRSRSLPICHSVLHTGLLTLVPEVLCRLLLCSLRISKQYSTRF